MDTFRRKIEEVVRELMRPQTAADQALLTSPIDGSSSIERQADLARMDEIRAQQITELMPMKERSQALTAQLATLDRQRAELRQEWEVIERQRLSRYWQLTMELDKLDVKVRKSAPPSIDAFITELNQEEASLRERRHSQVQAVGERNLYSESMKKQKSFYSDGPSITRRLSAVHEVRQVAEGLKIERLTDEQLFASIAELQAGLPPIVEEELDPWVAGIMEHS